MILIDFFTEACCKGTELVEGWYWHEDDGDAVGRPIDYSMGRTAPQHAMGTL
jgi:hypothetical protein